MLRFVLVGFLVACGGSPAPAVDGSMNMGSADASTPAPGTFGATCTTVSNMSTECNSGVCTDAFNMFPTPVCSQQCTMLDAIDPSCPVGSMGQKCNKKGFCRP